jgi:hypothetical protein
MLRFRIDLRLALGHDLLFLRWLLVRHKYPVDKAFMKMSGQTRKIRIGQLISHPRRKRHKCLIQSNTSKSVNSRRTGTTRILGSEGNVLSSACMISTRRGLGPSRRNATRVKVSAYDGFRSGCRLSLYNPVKGLCLRRGQRFSSRPLEGRVLRLHHRARSRQEPLIDDALTVARSA